MRRSPIKSSDPDLSGNQSPGKPGQLVLIDFGIAKLFSATTLVETGTIIRTPAYMPPEQFRGNKLPASDRYTLAVTCIHLIILNPAYKISFKIKVSSGNESWLNS